MANWIVTVDRSIRSIAGAEKLWISIANGDTLEFRVQWPGKAPEVIEAYKVDGGTVIAANATVIAREDLIIQMASKNAVDPHAIFMAAASRASKKR